jgi:hypothetical protein
VRLLERCVLMDATNAPVLRWQPVQSAAQTVSSRRRPAPAPRVGGVASRGRRGASVVPAAGGAGGGSGSGPARGGCSGGGAMSSLE